MNEKEPSAYVRASVSHPKYGRKTGKTERIRSEINPIWRQTIVYDRIKLAELEEAVMTVSIIHKNRTRKKLLAEVEIGGLKTSQQVRKNDQIFWSIEN